MAKRSKDIRGLSHPHDSAEHSLSLSGNSSGLGYWQHSEVVLTSQVRWMLTNLRDFPWKFFPWVTVFLAGLICVIHIIVPLIESPATFRASYGITPGAPYTYLTYGFLHAHLFHLANNTLGLLILGTVVELQVSRTRYISVIAISILAGAVYMINFPYPALPDLAGRVIGFSAAGWAITIIGIGVLIRHWRWGKGFSWVTICLFFLFIIYEAKSILMGELGTAPAVC